MQRAFLELGLNPQSPGQWRELARQLAWVLFPEVDRGGKPTEWNAERYCELLAAVYDAKLRSDDHSDFAACKFIATKSTREYFKKAGTEGLRKALRKARSPEHNRTLQELILMVEPRFKRAAEEAGEVWHKEREKQLARRMADRIGAVLSR